MKLSTARIVIWGCTAAVVLCGVIAMTKQSLVLFGLMGIALVAELVVFFGFIKCPHCGHHLDRAGMSSEIQFCPFCGQSLEDK